MNPKKQLDLISTCFVNSPRNKQIDGQEITVFLPSSLKIARVAFTFHEPVQIDSDGNLEFWLKEIQSNSISLSILDGDIGMPEINIENIRGEVYRFKRGNLKDFMRFENIHTEQKISLPLSAFLYNIDLKANVDNSTLFWEEPIKKINFDFLCSPKNEGVLALIGPQISFTSKVNLDINDLIVIQKVGKPDSFPKYVTENPRLSLSFQATHILSRLAKGPIIIEVSVNSNPKNTLRQFVLTEAKTYAEFMLNRYGQHFLNIKLLEGKALFLQQQIPVVRTIKTSRRLRSIGISDSALFSEAFCLSGSYRRTVVSLKSFEFSSDIIDISPNQSGVLSLPKSGDIKWIVALKGMPKWLSRYPEKHDYHRYGPGDLAVFRKFVFSLVEYLSNCGVDFIEPWNEANVIHEWNDSIDMLYQMQVVFYEATRLYNINLFSPSSTSWDFDYYGRLIKHGFHKVSDAFAIHGYT